MTCSSPAWTGYVAPNFLIRPRFSIHSHYRHIYAQRGRHEGLSSSRSVQDASSYDAALCPPDTRGCPLSIRMACGRIPFHPCAYANRSSSLHQRFPHAQHGSRAKSSLRPCAAWAISYVLSGRDGSRAIARGRVLPTMLRMMSMRVRLCVYLLCDIAHAISTNCAPQRSF